MMARRAIFATLLFEPCHSAKDVAKAKGLHNLRDVLITLIQLVGVALVRRLDDLIRVASLTQVVDETEFLSLTSHLLEFHRGGLLGIHGLGVFEGWEVCC